MRTRSVRKETSRLLASARQLSVERLEDRTMLAVSVLSTAETENTSSADDAAIWIHPTDPAQSTIIGAIKNSSSALRVYDLTGNELGRVSSGNVNNVDLRYNFPLSGQPTTLVVGSNRSNDSISIYKVNPQTRLLENVAARTISTGMNIYGAAMYVSPVTGKYYAFVTSESGQVQQWELFDDGSGEVDATQVRNFFVGSQSEGVVADDVLGWLYVGEENDGIWKYSAEPGGGSSRTLVDSTGGGGHLTADVEGLTIYYVSDGTGYLMASSQGADEFVVYRREGNNDHIGEFELISGGGIDGVSDTDGIDVTNVALGSQFPQGMFVAQDNDVNFKLARWDSVSNAFGGQLTVDTTWDPRQVGAAPTSIIDRMLFYNNSTFDGTPGVSASDDSAIATDKVAYMPGDGLADADHVSSYSRGINGVMIDVANLGGTLTPADFTFKAGANNTPASWSAAPAPTAFSVRPNAGAGNSDRVEIIWAEGALTNTWLEITVQGNDAAGGFNTNTGLETSDVFYFGSRVGDTFIDGGVGFFNTDATDEISARNHAGIALSATNAYDFNRDAFVDATDQIIARNDPGFLVAIEIPGPPPESAVASPNRQAVTTALAARSVETIVELPPTAIAADDDARVDAVRRARRSVAATAAAWQQVAAEAERIASVEAAYAPDPLDWLALALDESWWRR